MELITERDPGEKSDCDHLLYALLWVCFINFWGNGMVNHSCRCFLIQLELGFEIYVAQKAFHSVFILFELVQALPFKNMFSYNSHGRQLLSI